MVDVKGSVINFFVGKPVQAYIGTGALLLGVRWYQTQTTFNYWFGKHEMMRRIERNKLWWILKFEKQTHPRALKLQII